MFTGIIKEIGTVSKICRKKDICRLDIRSVEISKSVEIGGSVAVNGACLTVTEIAKDIISFGVMAETMRRTTIATLKEGCSVNLEPSLRAGEPLDGHFVTGHIDCVGKIRGVKRHGNEFSIDIETGAGCADRLVEKGSIAIDGVSLTAGNVTETGFTVFLIPHTLKVTVLRQKKIGDAVNVEFDIIGKYASGAYLRAGSGVNETFLRENGF